MVCYGSNFIVGNTDASIKKEIGQRPISSMKKVLLMVGVNEKLFYEGVLHLLILILAKRLPSNSKKSKKDKKKLCNDRVFHDIVYEIISI